ncbi:MAG: small ribosomal subunit Rsm22 family protein [Parachlamydiaceae bacterium]
MLPEKLEDVLDHVVSSIPQGRLTKAYSELSSFYKERGSSLPLLKDKEQKYAYLVARFPATFAAVTEVLSKLSGIYPLSPNSFLDLGAGPGTAFLAAQEVFGGIKSAHLVERDSEFIDFGKKIMNALGSYPCWELKDLKQLELEKNFDLVVASYSLGELEQQDLIHLLNKVWPKVSGVFAIIEPGTPRGFERIKLIRQHLIDQGGFPIAPCPHADSCPMSYDDWCHFNVRLERNKSHRLVKQAALAYEDEKFSYIAISKQKAVVPTARIVRHPTKHTGHVNFTLCTAAGIQKKTLSKKDKAFYKDARKKGWGDDLSF